MPAGWMRSCRWWACLTGAVASISLASCGSGGGGLDQSSLASVATIYANAQHGLYGKVDVVAMMSIITPSCNASAYRRSLERSNRSQRRARRRATPSELEASRRHPLADRHPVIVQYAPVGTQRVKQAPLADVPSSGIKPRVIVNWGGVLNPITDKGGPPVDFVRIDGKWYLQYCPPGSRGR